MATTILSLKPAAAELPSSNPAQWLIQSTDEMILAFDASAAESALWKDVVPQIYSGTALTAYIHYRMATAISGTVIWNVYVESIADGEAADAASFDALNSSGAVTVPGSTSTLDVASITLSNADSTAAGEKIRIRLERDAVGDSAAGDAYVFLVEIRAA